MQAVSAVQKVPSANQAMNFFVVRLNGLCIVPGLLQEHTACRVQDE